MNEGTDIGSKGQEVSGNAEGDDERVRSEQLRREAHRSA